MPPPSSFIDRLRGNGVVVAANLQMRGGGGTVGNKKEN